MENQKKKCSLKKHSEIDAINYCQECKVYLCNKCNNHHSELFETHHIYSSNKNINVIFTGFCKEKGHDNIELKYFCKNHNKLCCGNCISKIKDELNGYHKDCNVCLIKEIKDVKKNILIKNIKYLEEMNNKFEQLINDLDILLEKINLDKENLKLEIQNVFTKIKNILNEREDELLLEVDKQFNNLFFNEDLIKDTKKLPDNIKISLEKGKNLDKDWKENELNLFINDCLEIENSVKDINIINENIQKNRKNKYIKIKFIYDEDEINKIKKFGKLLYNKFSFKKCPININDQRKYIISGEKMNILTKTGKDGCWMGAICENKFEKSKEYKWKIKILKSTQYKFIMVGVAPIDFDINLSQFDNCGWYFYCCNSQLYSGPPHNYSGKYTNLKKVNDEIVIVMNMNKRTLKFIINNEDKGESYTDIPIDKPLFPAVFLYNINDSIEILEC